MTIEEWIESLPITVDGLRDYLVANGRKGKVSSVFNCPLAKDASDCLGMEVSVNGEQGFVVTGDFSKVVCIVNLPEVCREFVVNFDNEEYPELIED